MQTTPAEQEATPALSFQLLGGLNWSVFPAPYVAGKGIAFLPGLAGPTIAAGVTPMMVIPPRHAKVDRSGAETLAAGELPVWLLAPEQQAVLAATGIPPVINDRALQDRFWTGGYSATADFAVVGRGGIWQRFFLPTAGRSRVGDVLTKPGAENPEQLLPDLKQVEQELNVWASGRKAPVTSDQGAW